MKMVLISRNMQAERDLVQIHIVQGHPPLQPEPMIPGTYLSKPMMSTVIAVSTVRDALSAI
ncbi:Uncharacterised protein [Mycobacterium tuberculosis]|nr:Uncharacterised protein [Mycobacterium tuberculosis]